jgi:hypothetical protein
MEERLLFTMRLGSRVNEAAGDCIAAPSLAVARSITEPVTAPIGTIAVIAPEELAVVGAPITSPPAPKK